MRFYQSEYLPDGCSEEDIADAYGGDPEHEELWIDSDDFAFDEARDREMMG